MASRNPIVPSEDKIPPLRKAVNRCNAAPAAAESVAIARAAYTFFKCFFVPVSSFEKSNSAFNEIGR